MNKWCFFLSYETRVSLITFGSLVFAKMSNTSDQSDELKAKFENACKNAYDFNSALKLSNVLQSDIDDLRKKLETKKRIVPKSLNDRQVRLIIFCSCVILS